MKKQTVSYAACTVGIAPLRSEPSHRAEQISQVLFGERIEILSNGEGSWQRVRALSDDYEGWCQAVQFCPVPGPVASRSPKWYSTARDSRLILPEGQAVSLPPGAELWALKKGQIQLRNLAAHYKGAKRALSALAFSEAAITHWLDLYRGAPYLWGGRTPAGVDCSGLVQMAARFCGVQLPRDAWQQAEKGEEVSFLEMARAGDLAFFDNDAGRIVHVGMLVSCDTIVHATETVGRVVQDKIDPGGIISVTLRKRTHRLRVIKRVFSAEKL